MEKLKTCPVCSAKEFSLLYKYGAPDRVAVYNNICHGCGVVFQSPRPTFDELREYYEAYSDKSQGASVITPATERHLLAISEIRYEFLEPHLEKGMKILDIGCGIGQLLSLLKEAGMVVKGVNPEEKYSAYGRKRFAIDIETSMLEDANLAEGEYDLVIFDHVFEHLNDPHRGLEISAKVLKTGGKLFISTNNVLTPHGFLWQNFFLDHTITYSPGTIGVILGMHGFEVTELDDSGNMTYEGYHYPYMNLIATYTGKKLYRKGDDWKKVHEKLMSYAADYIRKKPYHCITFYIRIFLSRYISRYVGLCAYLLLTTPIPKRWRPKLYDHTLPPKRIKP